MSGPLASRRLQASLMDLALLAIMTGLAAIVTVAMVLQYAGGEIPCPLCLLQRVAMLGICFGIVLHFRQGHDDARSIGMSFVWALVLLIVSVRQVLLNIVARPGHAYPGSAVLGLHMPVWSVVIAVSVLFALAVALAAFGPAPGDGMREDPPSPRLATAASWAGAYVIALSLVNLASAIVQCGLDACHTTGYRLL